MSRFGVDDKVVVVTGASSGIGAAVARALAGRGAKVVLVARSQDRLETVAATLPDQRVLPLPADVSDLAQMRSVAERTVAEFGRIDVVFANAGIATDPPVPIAGADVESYERVIEVDLLGVWRTVKACLPEVVGNQGYVLVTASFYAFFNGLLNSAYAASKAGVEMFGRSLRAELSHTGARAGVLYPGWVVTPLSYPVRGGNPAVSQMVDRVFRGPLGTFIQPEQVARAVVAGIEKRAPRIFVPKVWAPVSLMRGVVNLGSDAWLGRDRGIARLVEHCEDEACPHREDEVSRTTI